jgi:predicted dehydrogenase
MPDPKAPVRIAVVGAGFIGRHHIEYLEGHSRFELIAVSDPSPEAAEYLSAKNVQHFADYRHMLESTRPEGVVVATPNALHEEVTVASLERGIPALVEKPIAHTLESAQRICAAHKRTGVPVLVGHHRRHNPLMRAAREFIRSGGIGKLVSVAAINLRRKPDAYYEAAWKRSRGGGPLLINGIHDLDCLRSLCGEIESVMAYTANRARGFEVEDSAAVTIRFENGAIGNLTLSDAVQAPWAWEITSGEEAQYPHQREDCYLLGGTDGSLAVPTLSHWKNEKGGGRADPFIRKELFYVPANPWVEELLHFAAVVRREAEPVVSADDGTRTLAAVLAVAKSAETGRPVALREMVA